MGVAVVSYDPLVIAAAFCLLAASGALFARRLHSWLAVIVCIAFAYCAGAQLIRFGLQYVADSRAVPFGQALVRLWLFWPVGLLVAGFALLALAARRKFAL